jgi:hypothetical protein
MKKLLTVTSAIALATSQIAITATASLAAIPPFNNITGKFPAPWGA